MVLHEVREKCKFYSNLPKVVVMYLFETILRDSVMRLLTLFYQKTPPGPYMRRKNGFARIFVFDIHKNL